MDNLAFVWTATSRIDKNPQFCYTTEPSKGNTLKNCFTTKGACDDALHDDPGATGHKCKTD